MAFKLFIWGSDMAALTIKDTTGRVILDMTSAVPREIGSFSTGTSSGSTTVSVPAGRLWWVRSVTATTGRKGKGPALTVSGNTFTWAFSYVAGLNEYPVAATIYYGVY
jgi:hypothetical protein